MTGPLEFVEAAHKQAEEIAQAATPGPWRHDPAKHWRKTGTAWFEEAVFAGPAGKDAVCVAGTGETGDPHSVADATHIALQDPAAVLRRIAAERKLLADLRGEPHGSDCWALVRSGRPCDCGRDDRVNLRVRLLAEGWGWEDGAGDG